MEAVAQPRDCCSLMENHHAHLDPFVWQNCALKRRGEGCGRNVNFLLHYVRSLLKTCSAMITWSTAGYFNLKVADLIFSTIFQLLVRGERSGGREAVREDGFLYGFTTTGCRNKNCFHLKIESNFRHKVLNKPVKKSLWPVTVIKPFCISRTLWQKSRFRCSKTG